MLEGLDPGSARLLVQREGDHDVSEDVCSRLHAAVRANPLGLIEGVRLLDARECSGLAPLPSLLRPGPRIERAFSRRIAGLSVETRRTLLVAAAAEGSGATEISAALRELGLSFDALGEAEREGIVVLRDGLVEFSHPLLRAVSYHAATDSERREVHLALARSVGSPRVIGSLTDCSQVSVRQVIAAGSDLNWGLAAINPLPRQGPPPPHHHPPATVTRTGSAGTATASGSSFSAAKGQAQPGWRHSAAHAQAPAGVVHLESDHGHRRAGHQDQHVPRQGAAQEAPLATALAPPAIAATPRMFVFEDALGPLNNPTSLAIGPDGAAWFSEYYPDEVGRVDLAGRFRGYRTSGPTQGIAVLGNGTVLATEPTRGAIVRITRTGKVSEIRTPTRHANPQAIVRGPDGNAWFIETSVNNPDQSVSAIGRITPGGRITEFRIPPLTLMLFNPPAPPQAGGPVDAAPTDIVSGPEGRLWFTTLQGVGNITTAGRISTIGFPFASNPATLGAAPGGTLWVGDSNGYLPYYTASGGVVQGRVALSNPPTSFATSRAGSFYFTATADPELWQITGHSAPKVVQRLRGVFQVGMGQAQISDPGNGHALAPGPAGTLWLAASIDQGGSTGGVAVFDPRGSCITPNLVGERNAQFRLDLFNHGCSLGRTRIAPGSFGQPQLPAPLLAVQCQRPAAGSVRAPRARVNIELNAYPINGFHNVPASACAGL